MEAHDHGLAADLEAMMKMGSDRRRSLRWLLAGAATLPLIGCGGGSDNAGATTDSSGTITGTSGTTGTTGSATCSVIPEETGGP